MKKLTIIAVTIIVLLLGYCEFVQMEQRDAFKDCMKENTRTQCEAALTGHVQ